MRSEHKSSASEIDAFTGWRKVLCYMQRAGVRKKIKRDSHRKDRMQAKREIRREVIEDALDLEAVELLKTNPAEFFKSTRARPWVMWHSEDCSVRKCVCDD